MRPFNLEEALAGEPVILRNGTKAYVKYVMPEEYTGNFPLRGYFFDEQSDACISATQWTKNGNKLNDLGTTFGQDVVGMWNSSYLGE